MTLSEAKRLYPVGSLVRIKDQRWIKPEYGLEGDTDRVCNLCDTVQTIAHWIIGSASGKPRVSLKGFSAHFLLSAKWIEPVKVGAYDNDD